MYKILLCIATLLLATGCDSKVKFSVDNPTGAPLKLQIDQKPYEIPALQSKELELAPGEHSIDAPATGKLNFIVYLNGKGGLINPTLSDYVIVSEMYVPEKNKGKDFNAFGVAPLTLDGVTVKGPFELVNGLFIDKNWQFGVQEPFAASVRDNTAGIDVSVYRKIFTATDFMQYFEKHSGQAGYFKQNRQYKVAAVRPLSAPEQFPDFADPQLHSASLKLRELYQRYQRASDPAEQKQLQSVYFKHVMDFTAVEACRSSSGPVEDRMKCDHFSRFMITSFGRSAQVKAQGAPAVVGQSSVPPTSL